jgi:hypothetical protein
MKLRSKNYKSRGLNSSQQLSFQKSSFANQVSQDGSIERKIGDDDQVAIRESEISNARHLGFAQNENVVESMVQFSNLPNSLYDASKPVELNLDDPESQV